MADILAGIFERNSDYKRLEMELESAGKQDSDYIVYLNDDHSSQYMATVQVQSVTEAEEIGRIFSENSVVKSYYIENMNIREASYDTVKKFINTRSKAEIHNSPDVKIKTPNDGMDSEVKF
ncbi:hypothetical protein ASG01_02945 [Chryseobacterium sp. Leaf180]|jgi:hypothetical protein|uniref:hypothetical protein n=1 Tax=Chryseobacterium sp. Leaf180 TaxID=1736289 RepID=UPI0006F7B7EA|nr:hypothetical protein [Chryseobacterium sp. Leaf180]KQR94838.1 hypothetical protein ASG01_02945 [Chryseobacterium sp. Leaf180]